ncbi:MAG TPA: aspartyl/asparaginyl beta-hydroxylase domain-containing protein [Pyrinomonadaceae bacterium]|nr:aspartyl/asparaginyl beta-hydroxylase domain-containing protein [Pyrinomonadaceae bacterium]
MNRNLKRTLKYSAITAVFIVLGWFFPVPVAIFFACGIWDVSRNRGVDAGVVRQYFLRNGIGTWFASPINILFDLLALPHINKGVYKLSDLPPSYQEEISGLLAEADEIGLVDTIDRKTQGMARAMYFFKWYGQNVDAAIEIPSFHREYNYVRTIGVSLFRERESTSRHFGPFRPSIRVLYCLNDDVGREAYIKVGNVEHHWRDEKLFIFDDTLLHQSFNETDEPRFVLFVDIIRPSYLPFVFDFAVSVIRVVFRGINGVFYKNWKLVDN